MKLSYEVTVEATPDQIWPYYCELEKWYDWEEDLVDIQLDDKEFVTGNTGTMTLEGMPPMKFILTSVIEGKEFIDSTNTPMGVITFAHFLIETIDGVIIRHEVSLDSEDEKHVEILMNIFNDVPKSVHLLKRLVEK